MNCSCNDSNQKISTWRITTKAISHEENIMTVIVYGKSTFAGNAKTRRHERRRKLAIERDTICNIIDSIFGCDAPDASQEVKAKRIDRVTKAISLAGTRQKEVEGGSVLLPDVALYAAGHRKSKQITAR
ncbi:regulator [Salmonella enterica subsp. enterica serovar Typhimurium]|nr:regulator [Salmonella enterica]EBW1564370.1 regulator [Salmonella enterica subsp. enterica serovar Typhimurium]ECJ4771618.1 regulator [Salmonella enterica subsp. enterica]EAM4221022.1 regulator [Salmonella enterica]EAN2766100.1 regulator [Salmonella enterica]